MINLNVIVTVALVFTSYLAGQSASAAVVYERTGSNLNQPTFTLPDRPGNFAYDAFSFRVSAAGDYTFVTEFDNDGLSILYANAFDASDSTKNLIALNDDYSLAGYSYTISGFTSTLDTNRNYVLISTDASGGRVIDFTTRVDGPGQILAPLAAVPEPETYAMLLAGMAAIGKAVRRRRGPPRLGRGA